MVDVLLEAPGMPRAHRPPLSHKVPTQPQQQDRHHTAGHAAALMYPELMFNELAVLG